MKELQFSITEMVHKAVDAPLYFDHMVEISDLATSESNDIRSIDEVQVTGFVFAEKEDFIFSFSITGSMILPCARTLVDVPYSFDIKANEVFSVANHENEDEEVHHISGEMLDLTPYIKENIILNMPYRVFSDEEEIPEGEGWDFYDEESFEQEKKATIDPRLAKLQQLRDSEKDK